MLKYHFWENMQEQTCMIQQFDYTSNNYISVVEKPSSSRFFSTFSAAMHEILDLHIVE